MLQNIHLHVFANNSAGRPNFKNVSGGVFSVFFLRLDPDKMMDLGGPGSIIYLLIRIRINTRNLIFIDPY